MAAGRRMRRMSHVIWKRRNQGIVLQCRDVTDGD